MGFMRNQYHKAKDEKFKLLFTVKPELNPVVHCAFHPSEGCDLCDYIVKCEIKENKKFGGDCV